MHEAADGGSCLDDVNAKGKDANNGDDYDDDGNYDGEVPANDDFEHANDINVPVEEECDEMNDDFEDD